MHELISTVAFTVPALLLGAWLLSAWIGFFGSRRISTLIPEASKAAVSSLSVIVPARNEAAALPRALNSLLASTYPDCEIIAVDDRSTDDTGRLLDTFARQNSRLSVIHMATLPAGWLGKTHALYAGYRQARGDWLLFTDADVVFDRRCLQTAITYAETEQLDHLVLAPDVETVGFWEPILVGCFGLLFGLLFRPWAARDPRSRASVGIGAFNLVRRAAYEAIGTHRALANAVIDDLARGAAIKAQGFRQAAMLGHRLLSVRWQIGLGGIVRGLEKNAYAGLHFSLTYALGGSILLLAAGLAPVFGVIAPIGAPLWAGAAVAGIACQAYHARMSHLPLWSALLQPLGFIVLAYAILRSTVLAHRRGGIEWRGTSYSLTALRDMAPVTDASARVDSDRTTG